MGVISLKRKIPSRNQRKRDNSIAKIFVDRESQRNIFKDHIAKISKEYRKNIVCCCFILELVVVEKLR